MSIIWLTKLLLSHLLTDFILQPKKWVDDRNQKHFASLYLYIHSIITAFVALALIGWQYWMITIIILVTHALIDGWKSYRKPTATFFLIDQFLHIFVIFGCWYFSFFEFSDIKAVWKVINTNSDVWIMLTAFIFLTMPTGIFIGQVTKKWRDQIPGPNSETLANAGKWIGIFERTIILTLVLLRQYEAIGLLVAAKTILRFSENNRPEIKTEYLLIGTLLSIGLAILTGIVVNQLIINY